MGYTGAVFERFFGSGRALLVSSGALLVWVALPAWLAMRRFTARDLQPIISAGSIFGMSPR